LAGDGRDSPLKYTSSESSQIWVWLGMAGIHRSSTLTDTVPTVRESLGMAGIHRSSTLWCRS